MPQTAGSLKPKIVYQLAVSFLYSAAPLLVFPYISRVLGPEGIGKINFIDYAAQFFILIATFGIPLYGVREVSRLRHDTGRLQKLTSELVTIHVLMTGTAIILFGLLLALNPGDFRERGLVWLAVINIAASAVAMEWLIHGLEDFAFLARRSFIIKVASLISVFVLVREADDHLIYYAILVGGNLLILAADLYYAHQKGIRLRAARHIKKHIKPLSLFFVTAVTLSIYTFFDTVILGLISGSLAVGFYTTALKVIRLSHNFINDLGGVMLPRVAYLVEAGDHGGIARIMNKSLAYVLTITIPLWIILFAAAPEIIFALGGDAFQESVIVLRMLSVLPLVIGLTNIFFIQILLPFRKDRQLVTGVVLGSVVSIVANIVLCPLFAQRGAAMACIAAELVVACLLGYHAAREVKLQVNRRQLAGIFLSALLLLPLLYLCRLFISNQLVVLLCFGLSGGILFILLQRFVFRNAIVHEIIQFFTTKLRSRIKPATPVS